MNYLLALVYFLGSVVFGGAEVRPASDLDSGWTHYVDHRSVSVVDSISVDGRDRELVSFVTQDRPMTVTEWYEARWGAIGFRIQRFDESSLSADDGVERRTVIATRKDRSTVVTLSRRFIEMRPVQISIPIPAACTPVHHSASGIESVRREFLGLRCESDAASVVDHFEEKWGPSMERLQDDSRGFLRFASSGDAALLYRTCDVEGEPVTYASLRWESK